MKLGAILNPLVLAYQALVASAAVASTQPKKWADQKGGVRLVRRPRRNDEPEFTADGKHKIIYATHEYCGRQYPYSNERQKMRQYRQEKRMLLGILINEAVAFHRYQELHA
jgi:hypothetical protein